MNGKTKAIPIAAALTVLILASLTSIPSAEAQGATLCLQDNPNCCPPQLLPYCGIMKQQDRFTTECTICNSQLDKFVYQGTLIQDFRTTQLLEMVQVQGTQIVNLQKEIDSMKGGVTTDWFSGGIITIGILVGISLVVGIANLRRKF